MKKSITLLFTASALFLAGCGTSQHSGITKDYKVNFPHGLVLKGTDRFYTPEAFRPPVAITIVAKTDSTDLRIGYAADQVIFNWKDNESQLRVDGGPADSRHTAGAGRIPVGKYVTIQWQVTPQHQAIFVDDELRFEHSGDYSRLDRQVAIFPAVGSTVTVKSVTVKQAGNVTASDLPPASPPGRIEVD